VCFVWRARAHGAVYVRAGAVLMLALDHRQLMVLQPFRTAASSSSRENILRARFRPSGKREAGSWKLEAGSGKREAGSWKLTQNFQRDFGDLVGWIRTTCASAY
jgi:hypothetical protein